MESDYDAQACADALREIIAKCDSYKGLLPSEEKQEEPEADVAVVIEAQEPQSEEMAEEEEPDEAMHIMDRPSDRNPMKVFPPPPVKKPRGRPRKDGY